MRDAVDFRIHRATVDGLEDEDLFEAIANRIWPDENVKDELAHIARATPGQRAIYVMTVFAREVGKGGIAEFFSDTSGVYAKTVADSLRLLGAKKMLEAYTASLAVFENGEPPLDHNARRSRIENLSDSESELLDSIDKRLSGGSTIEANLHPFFKRYIDTHPQEFFI